MFLGCRIRIWNLFLAVASSFWVIEIMFLLNRHKIQDSGHSNKWCSNVAICFEKLCQSRVQTLREVNINSNHRHQNNWRFTGRRRVKAASHDSQMLETATYSQQMTEVISSTSSFDQLNSRRRMLHFAGENRQLKFHRTPYPNYYFKEHFFFLINNYNFLGKFLERFCISTDMLSVDRLRQHRTTEKQ